MIVTLLQYGWMVFLPYIQLQDKSTKNVTVGNFKRRSIEAIVE